MARIFKFSWVGLMLTALLMAACGSDDAGGENTCPDGERYDPIRGQCLPRTTLPPALDMGDPDPDPVDMASDSSTLPDAQSDTDSEDASVDPDLGCTTDEDGDGYISMECGGDDCDDTNAAVNPGQNEVCDQYDNNCDSEINGGIDCQFYAQSDTMLYLIEPFRMEIEEVTPVPGLFDIDTHPDGTLYGITSTHLFEFDPATETWTQFPNAMGNLGTANGMAIDNDGTVFITSSSTLYTADLETGLAMEIGSIAPFVSSGDTVVTKDQTLYMTSSHAPTDTLIWIDGRDGSPTFVGTTGFDEIWGLTAAYNRLFGLTASGELIELDTATGAATLLHTFGDVSFFGAASTPGR